MTDDSNAGSPDERAGDDRMVLLVSNRRLDESAGRAEKFVTRKRLLQAHGWILRVGYVDPTPRGLVEGTARCVRMARDADVVNSVSNPPHLHISGSIAAHTTGSPWLAEFRDPLVENPDVDPDSIAGRMRHRLERHVLTRADAVVWYDGIQIPDDYFEREYPAVPSDRYRQLPPIGFEREKFESIRPETFDAFTVTYAGSFYEGWIEPHTFLEGLGRYVRAEDEVDDVQALFYGDWRDDYEEVAREAGVSAAVRNRPFVPHEQIVSVLQGSDALLYIGGDDPRNRLNLPSKLYDYIGARRPILAIVDTSFRAAEVIRRHGFGLVVEPGDPEGVRAALERIRSGDYEYDPDPAAIEKYTRERSTAAYIEALERVADT